MIIKPISRPLVTPLGDPLRSDALPWEPGGDGSALPIDPGTGTADRVIDGSVGDGVIDGSTADTVIDGAATAFYATAADLHIIQDAAVMQQFRGSRVDLFNVDASPLSTTTRDSAHPTASAIAHAIPIRIHPIPQAYAGPIRRATGGTRDHHHEETAMAELSDAGRERAKAEAGYMLAPTGDDQRFGPFAPGDKIVLSATAAFHAVAGDATIAATTSSPAFAAGSHGLVLPNGCTHVAMIQGGSAATGCAWKG